MVAILEKKEKKIGTDYFTFVFSQSKSEPKLFIITQNFISLVRSFRRVSKKRTYTIITRLCTASYNTQ